MKIMKRKLSKLIHILIRIEKALNEALSELLFGGVEAVEFTDIPLPSEQKEKDHPADKKTNKKKMVNWPKVTLGKQLQLFFKRPMKRFLYLVVINSEVVFKNISSRSKVTEFKNSYRHH